MEFESAKRHFREMVQKDVRFKLIEHTFLGEKKIKPYPKIGKLLWVKNLKRK